MINPFAIVVRLMPRSCRRPLLRLKERLVQGRRPADTTATNTYQSAPMPPQHEPESPATVAESQETATMLFTKQTASRLGVSEQTVRNMHKTARIYGEQRGRGYYFPDTQIIRRNANGQSRVVDGLSTVLAAFDEPADAWIWLKPSS